MAEALRTELEGAGKEVEYLDLREAELPPCDGDECYDEPENAKRLYRELLPAERQIDGVDFAAATRACPEGVDIATRLKLAQELLA